MSTDTTFFTNEPNSTLVERFKVLLKHSQFLDVIVGYFRISGFNLLKDDFEKIDKIRILNGINVDRGTIQAIESAENKVDIRTNFIPPAVVASPPPNKHNPIKTIVICGISTEDDCPTQYELK